MRRKLLIKLKIPLYGSGCIVNHTPRCIVNHTPTGKGKGKGTGKGKGKGSHPGVRKRLKA